MTIKINAVRTLPVSSFSHNVQQEFGAICQHVDWFFEQTNELFGRIAYMGSESWICGNDPTVNKVLVKAIPWDRRVDTLAAVLNNADEGVAVMVRDDVLTPNDMRVLWDEFGDAYRPSPPSDLYSVVPQRDRAFQLLECRHGENGCDVFKLPGVEPEAIEDRLAQRSQDGILYVGAVAAQNSVLTQSSTAQSSSSGSDRIVVALKEIIRKSR